MLTALKASTNKKSKGLHAQNLHIKKQNNPKSTIYETQLWYKCRSCAFVDASLCTSLRFFSAGFVRFCQMTAFCWGFWSLRSFHVFYSFSFNHHPPTSASVKKNKIGRSSNIQKLPALQRHLSSNQLYRQMR